MKPDTANLVLFVGHFHPLLVHLPIGGLVLLGLLELLATRARWKDAAQNSRWIIGFVCATAVLSAVLGLMLAQAGGYDAQILKWHQASGIALALAAMVAWSFRFLDWRRSYRVSLLVAIALLVVASHLGGSITHGRDFLTRYAPAPLRALVGRALAEAPQRELTGPPMQKPVFTGVVEPILQQRCVSCHGVEKHKGGLRLDTLEGLLAGGQDGPVIIAGRAKNSALVQSMVSALDADGHMPPEEHAQATAEEISLIAWWINGGAPAAAKVADLKPEPDIKRLLELVAQRPDSARLKETQ